LLIVFPASVHGADDDLVFLHAGGLTSWQAPPSDVSGVLVSTGGTLDSSPEAQRTDGVFAAQGLTAQGYMAVNLIPGDFARGFAKLQPALAGGPFLSANIKDRAGKRVVPASLVLTIGKHKVGFTGVTMPPDPADAAAKTFSADLTAAEPVESLKDVVAQLAKDSDVHVLLVNGTSTFAAGILRAYPDFQLCIVGSGAAEPGVIRIGSAALVQSPLGGQAFGVTVLPAGAVANARSEVRLASPKMSAAMRKAYADNHLPVTPLDAATTQPVAAVAAISTPDRFPEDGLLQFAGSASNRGVKLTTSLCRLTSEYGTAKAPAGSSFLVVASTWENIIPLTLIAKRNIPTEYQVPNLGDHIYVVVNGSMVARLAPDAVKLPGHVPVAPLKIAKLGETVHGNLVFALPPAPIKSLELRFYDFAHGHMVIPLVTSSEPVAAALFPSMKNQVLEASINGVQKAQALGGANAPGGMVYVLIDLRARSVMFTEADATAFDPKASEGRKLQVGTVADWKESRKYMQLILDGEYGYPPLAQSDLIEEPRFLPDIMTGGRAVFLVPDKYTSLELRCDFPNAKLPNGTVQRIDGLTLPVEGKRPPLPARQAIVTTRDDIFDLAIVSQTTADEFAGKKAEAGHRFLVLDVTVQNLGRQQEFFQTREQLKYATEAGAMVNVDDATFRSARAPGDLIYIPVRERRTFQLAYSIPKAETHPRLAYASATQGGSKVLKLKPLTAPVGPAEGQLALVPPNPPVTPPPVSPAPPVTPTQTPPMRPEATNIAAPAVASNLPPVNVPIVPPAITPPRPHGPAKGIEGVGLTAEQVNQAIDKGAAGLWAFLKQTDLKRDVNTFGSDHPHVLCALAMVHSGAHKKIPEFNSALRNYLTHVKPQELGTYENGLLCMLIEAYGDPAFAPQLRQSARWLLEAQGAGGTWDYQPRVPVTLFKPVVQTTVLQIVGGAPEGAAGEEWTRLTDWKIGKDGDNSVSQFAILGLQAASRSGIQIPAETWKRALAATRQRQCNDGGWGYNAQGNTGYGSMTSAGICAVAICKDRLNQPNPASDEAITRGVAWLDTNFKVDKHPKRSNEFQWAFYYLYSVERVGRTLDTEFLGQNEWYPLGAAYLVHSQKPDGTWKADKAEENDPRLATSFSLLFLTRATPPLKPLKRQGPGTLRTAAVTPENRFYIILDASGSMLDQMDGQMKFDIARGSVQSLINALPTNCEVALRVYGHRKTAIEKDADSDTELRIPMQALDRKKFIATLNSLRSRGKTPLALSIEDAIKDLGDVAPDKPVTLLLLTDGGEDTIHPRGNPLKAAEALGKVENVKFHIVGFDINTPDWSQQLQAMAERSGGRYWPAAKAADLERSVRNAVLGVPDQFTVADADGHEITHGFFGDPATLPAGKYRFKTLFAGRDFDEPFNVNAGEMTSITFDASKIPPGPTPAATAVAPKATPDTSIKIWPKFCVICGTPVQAGQKFCSKCGARIEPK
jgi:Mg-chelatase subunit ChlD